jgi:ankyrin repeat protein
MADATPPLTLSQLVDGHMSNDNRLRAIQLIEEGSTVNDRDISGNTPLICAVRSGHFDIAKMLLDRNVDISFRNTHGFSALHYVWWGSSQNEPNSVWIAKEQGAVEIFNELMHRNPAALDSSVVFSGNNDRIRAIRLMPSMLAHRPDLAHSRGLVQLGDDEKCGGLLHWVIGHAGWVRQCSRFDHYAYSKMFGCGKLTAEGEIKLCLTVMSKLITLGVAINRSDYSLDDDEDGQSLHQNDIAACDGATSIDRSDDGCATALAAAVTCGFEEGVSLLLEARADANSRCSVYLRYQWYHECTVLMHSSFHGSIPIMKALIHAFADVNACAHVGHTALTMLLQSHVISSKVSLHALKLLLDASADCNAALPDGTSALALAMKCPASRLPTIERERKAIRGVSSAHDFMESEALVLLRSGARVSQSDVHVAVDLGMPNVTRHLLSHGGSVSETLAYVSTRYKKDKSFYGNFMYPFAVVVSYCKIPHLSYFGHLPKLLPLHAAETPLRAKALCLGGFVLHLLVAFAKPLPNWMRLQRLQLLRTFLPVLLRCTGVAAAVAVASVKSACPGFVQIHPDFDVKNSVQGFCWLPERCKAQVPQSRAPRSEDRADREIDGALQCSKKCELM